MTFGTGSECCNPCPTVQTVNIPGSTGSPGTPGTPGTDGVNGYGILTANMNVPPDTITPVNIAVDNSQWMVIGETIIIGQGTGSALTNPGPAHFIVTALPSSVAATLLWLNQSGDVPAGTQIDLGAIVGPSGSAVTGFPTTTKGDVMVDNGALSPSPSVQRMAVGANGTALIADSTQALGRKNAGVSQTLNVNITPSVNPNNNVENTLMSFSVPANTLITNNDSLEFECSFTTANSVNDKTIKIYFGATVLFTFALVGAAAASLRIQFTGRIYRSGAATQVAIVTWVGVNGVPTQFVDCAFSAPGEALAGAVLFKATGTLAVAAANQITQVSQIVDYRAT